ncbi:MAG: hypothetical protein NC548_40820 [Lachnospiraceae bacterium]|nr:hypothetical protein [Lachnospiraceae bacterium]
MNEITKQHETDSAIDSEIEFDGKVPYFFSPSITKTRTVNGKSYTVRSYYTGGKDIHETVKRLAEIQAHKNAG